MLNRVLSLVGRAAITALAFWLIFRNVDVASLRDAFSTANRAWLLAAVVFFSLAQLGCVTRWRMLVPPHPALKWKFLVNSYLVASFFNTFLPTTVGGDVLRSYDLIKATGQWRESLASVLMDRLVGLATLMGLGLAAWLSFPPARTDPVLRGGFFGFCLIVLTGIGFLSSRRVLHTALRPFGKIGLGQLQAHAKQLQESLLAYFHEPKRLLKAFGISLGTQVAAVPMFVAISRALHLQVPILFFILVVPIVITVSQLPISLNGWGIREGATILFFQRIGIEPARALTFSLICATIPLLAGAIGGILFLLRRRRRRSG